MAKKQATNDTANAEPKVRKPKGPELNWDESRDASLITAVASGITSTSDIATALASDPAFAGVEPGAITAGKVRLHLANLRAAGVPIPKFGRSKGYKPNVEALSALLGVQPGV